ncbi:hypothetical protein C1Y63_09620 [Corynebacterium sp. 13CS0277]|uniref:sugar nucleotide-binding protein n=1 Tax=Corynebacterium sp. 13CS0277 TaxID=2071994 RepID=UPI000D02447E|nr:sugar nucleotide-binding protein [Corynebacterium sp. 13CS0277]PRQ10795.1 hypothetical protein C1Y63_09620 [Corynebacterium sp. 13CS0277]
MVQPDGFELLVVHDDRPVSWAVLQLLRDEAFAAAQGVLRWHAVDAGAVDCTRAGALRNHPVVAAVRASAHGHPRVVMNLLDDDRVDLIETDPEVAAGRNVTAAHELAAVAAELGAYVVQLSSVFVFPLAPQRDATGAPRPFEATEPVGPASVYGMMKARAEDIARAGDAPATIVRTGLVYGGPAYGGAGEPGKDLVGFLAEKFRQGGVTFAPQDQVVSTSYAIDVAAGLLRVAQARQPGTVHLVNEGQVGRAEFAAAIAAAVGAPGTVVRAMPAERYAQAAPRGSFAVLGTDTWRAGGNRPLPSWRDALQRAIAEDTTPPQL